MKQNNERGIIMLEELTLGEKLKDLRLSHGYKNTESLAKVTEISKSTLNNYENDEKNQSVIHTNLVELANLYGVTTDYLLGATTSDQQSRCEITELKLTDEVIALLKTDTLNHRLLCALLQHENFPNFLRSIEIFVDDLASKKFSEMNSELKIYYQHFSKKELPQEDKKHLDTLKAGQIQADRYFKSVIYEDLDIMVGEIREQERNNKKDPYHTLQNADVKTQVKKWVKDLGQLDYIAKKKIVSSMDKQVRLLIEESNLDLTTENTVQTAMGWILSMRGVTPEEIS